MELLEIDLARVRDYTGVQVPTDLEIYVLAEAETYWQEVALRILRRRLANSNSGEATTSFSLSGVLSVGMAKSDLSILTSQIRDLQTQLDELNGIPSGSVFVTRARRPDRVW